MGMLDDDFTQMFLTTSGVAMAVYGTMIKPVGFMNAGIAVNAAFGFFATVGAAAGAVALYSNSEMVRDIVSWITEKQKSKPVVNREVKQQVKETLKKNEVVISKEREMLQDKFMISEKYKDYFRIEKSDDPREKSGIVVLKSKDGEVTLPGLIDSFTKNGQIHLVFSKNGEYRENEFLAKMDKDTFKKLADWQNFALEELKNKKNTNVIVEVKNMVKKQVQMR